MAKSKLYAKLRTAVVNYTQMYERVLEETQKGAIPDEVMTAMGTRSGALKAAFAEADTYFQGLERRMGPDKTVGDRLKNMKNFFKDSKQLAAERKKVKEDLGKLEDLFLTVERCVDMVIQYSRAT
jgi:hypothetical protein